MTDPASGSDSGRYQLTADKNTAIFRKRILPRYLAEVTSRENPVAVVLVGQPGAGKTRAAQQLRDVLAAEGGFVEVDSDLYKPFHPQYAALLETDDRIMAAAIGPDGRAWMAQVQDHVREHKLHALVHEIAQDPECFAQTLNAYRDAGFRVVVVALAVAEGLSRQGIVARYCSQVQDRGSGRPTVAEKAAAAYVGIAAAAALVDRGCLADAVAVFRRSFDSSGPAYYNELVGPDRWRDRPRFADVIIAERDRALDPAEREEFDRTQRWLRTVAPADLGPEIDAIDGLVDPLIPRSDTPPALHPARVAAAGYPSSIKAVSLGAAAPGGRTPAVSRRSGTGPNERRDPPARHR